MIFRSEETAPVPGQNVLSWLFDKVEYPEDRQLYIDGSDNSVKEATMTLGMLRDNVTRVASGLRKAGLKDNDTVCLYAYNRVWYPVMILATICAGGRVTGVNPACSLPELVHQVSHSETRMIIAEPQLVSMALKAADECPLLDPKHVYSFERSVGGQKSVNDLIDRTNHYQWRKLTPEESKTTTALLMYSSGTTGKPKGVEITHFNIIANLTQSLLWRKMYVESLLKEGKPIPPPSKTLSHLPMFHTYGMTVSTFMVIKLGVTTIVLPRFQLENLLKNIQKYRVTALNTVPPVVVAITKSPLSRKYDLSSLELVTCGAAPLDKDTENALRELLKNNVEFMTRQGWGMTELTCTGSSWAMHHNYAAGSSGHIMPNMEARIVSEEGKDLAANEVGELLIRGPNVMKGYFKDPESTRNTIIDGWLHTGDIAKIDSEGRLFIVDRKKELIKVSGFQVAPAELEGVLLEHPNVRECCVVGVKTRDGNELPRAYVVAAHEPIDVKDVESFVNGKVSSYKKLKGGIVAVKEIPKTPSGKLLRRKLRDQANSEVQSRL